MGWGHVEEYAQKHRFYLLCHDKTMSGRFWAVAGPEAQARELMELQHIYMDRGLDRELARQVSQTLYRQKPSNVAVSNLCIVP